MKRKIISLVLVLAMALSISASANGIMPLWDNADNCNPKLTFNGNTANCSVSVDGKPGTSRITSTMTLQKQNADGSYSNVVTWGVKVANSLTTTRTETCTDCAPGTYLLTATVYVYDADGVGECIVVTATARH